MSDTKFSAYITGHVLPFLSNEDYITAKPDPVLLKELDETRARFKFTKCLDYHLYVPKKGHRYKVAKAHFPEAFRGEVADVGDREGAARSLVEGTLTTLDKNNPDLPSFDWDRTPLPFADKKFDSVLCLDTLEHINDMHTAFDDLLRVSKNHVVISLPNCWKKAPKELLHGRTIRASYGLPIVKPMDRHRWYMNTEDIEDFFFYNAPRNGFAVSDICYYAPQTVWWHRLLPTLRHVLPEYYFKNLFVQGVFVHLTRLPTH